MGLGWGGSRSTKPCVFPFKVAAAGDEGYLVRAAVAAGVVPSVIGSSLVFCNAWMQIAWQWLHECAHAAAKRIVMAA